jgi:hypothetical protein
MSRPKRVGMELGDGIGRDFFDRSSDSRFMPSVIGKGTMPTEDNHA